MKKLLIGVCAVALLIAGYLTVDSNLVTVGTVNGFESAHLPPQH